MLKSLRDAARKDLRGYRVSLYLYSVALLVAYAYMLLAVAAPVLAIAYLAKTRFALLSWVYLTVVFFNIRVVWKDSLLSKWCTKTNERLSELEYDIAAKRRFICLLEAGLSGELNDVGYFVERHELRCMLDVIGVDTSDFSNMLKEQSLKHDKLK